MGWAFLLSATLFAAGPATADDDAPLLLVGASVLNEAGDRLLDDRSILVEGGRIAAVGPEAEKRAPAGVKRVALDGLTLIPGLIDLHSHLLLHPYHEASWDDQVLREALEFRVIRGVVAARATLEAGFTTLRDLGTEGAGFADVALRDAIAAGLVPGPRIYAVTRAIVATGCYGPAGFDPRWDVPKGAQEATGVEEVRHAVRQQIAAGADWIKVYADYHRRPGEPATPTFSTIELSAIVDECRSAQVRVAAHATTDEGVRRAVVSGVATIEHGYGASAEVLAMMKQRGVVLCPTLTAAEFYARYKGWKPGEPDPPEIRQTKAMFERALAGGVTIACGSDVGVFPHGENAREIELMVASGMPAAQALRAATATAARVLGREQDLGRIAPGLVADLVAVKGNPLTDPSILRRAILVCKDGRIVVDRRAAR